MTPTTVEMLAARPKEQRCLEVLAWAKWFSVGVRIFTTTSGSLVAPSCSTHTRTVSTLSESPMTSWHLTSQACESQCATEQPKRFCCNGSAFASRSWKQGAGKAVTRCEENGFDKKFVQKVLNKIITKQPLPRTNGWSEGDSAKPQSFQCKQNGFRSQKIQHSRCASWFGGVLSHGATIYVGSVCLGFAETQPAVVETPIMGKSWKVTMTCYGRAQALESKCIASLLLFSMNRFEVCAIWCFISSRMSFL